MLTQKYAHRDVWRLAGPMILSNLTIPLLGLVDTAVVGHLEAAHYLGAVAIGGLVFSFVYWGFGFLRMGTTGLVAQAHGRGDALEISATLFRALLIAVLIAIGLVCLQQPLIWLALSIIEAGANVEQFAAEYFYVRIWSAPATLVNYVLIGWFLGMQNARNPLYLLLLINIVNIILDFVFVWGFGMQVAGVALASVIAEYLGMILGLYLVWRMLPSVNRPGWFQILDREKLKQQMLLNQNILIRTLCLIFSFSFFTAQGAKFGDVILAANAILMNFQTLMAYGLDGFAHAAEALVGKAVGQRDRRKFNTAVLTAGLWSVSIALVVAVVYFLFGPQLIWLLTDLDAVQETALLYLPWLIIAPILSVWSYLFDGIFIGATRSREMRDTMLVSTLFVFLPVWYLAQPLGNHGLWLA